MKRDAQKALLAAAGRYIRKLFGEVEPRLKAIEERAGAIPEIIERTLAALPAPKDGRDGVDGKDGRDGVDGKGEKGDPGSDGRDGASIDEIRSLVVEAVKALPPAKDGTSVTVDEVLAALEPRIESAMAKAMLDFERRAQGVLERAVERMPKPKDGADGRDGFSLDDLVIEDDDGTLTLRFSRGDLVREKAIRYPRGDRGFFAEDAEYRKGDGITYGGSYWLATKDAPAGKPGLSDDWRLAVRKGRDGKDGRNGIDKTAPVKL